MKHSDSGGEIQIIDVIDNLVDEFGLYSGKDHLEFVIRKGVQTSNEAIVTLNDVQDELLKLRISPQEIDSFEVNKVKLTSEAKLILSSMIQAPEVESKPLSKHPFYETVKPYQ